MNRECITCGKYIPHKMKIDGKTIGMSGRKSCIDCVPIGSTKKEIVLNHCIECDKETQNPKFCSKSCNIRYNNSISPKREKQVTLCKECNCETTERKAYCDQHNPLNVDWSNVTLGEVKNARSYQAHSRIRELARSTYRKSSLPKVCCNCGYDKHYEVCHIHAIKDFSDDTSIAEINDIKNLIALCPNCHWELDNNLLEL